MYGFVGHQSACEGLRALHGNLAQWPSMPRKLPGPDECVTTQRDFKRLSQDVDFAAYGIVSTPVDLLVPSATKRSRGKGAAFHVWKSDIPTHSMLRLDDKLLLSGPEFTIIQLAGYQLKITPLLGPFVNELNIEREIIAASGIDGEPVVDDPRSWEKTLRTVELARLVTEFAGTYRLGTGGRGAAFGVAPLTSKSQVNDVLTSLPGGYWTRRVEYALSLAFNDSASPLETMLVLMLTLPLEFGGFGLPRPKLNVPIDVSAAAVNDGRSVIIPDLLWPNERVCLEYDSDEFHTRGSRSRAAIDAQRANTLTVLGYTTLRATTATVAGLGSLSRLAAQLAATLGTQLDKPSRVQAARRTKLFAFLSTQQ